MLRLRRAGWRLLERLALPRFPWPAADGGGATRVPVAARLSAWEAELAAYARWRTGNPALTVRFGLATSTAWGEEIVLARPAPAEAELAGAGGRVPVGAELELEHLLAHHRHGWREAALLWQVWADPATPVTLPWPPWERVRLPPAVVRQALAGADSALAVPPERAATGGRQRPAALWLAAAWADGRHRRLALADRPGLAVRLPPPPAPPAGASVWERVLGRLAAGQGPGAGDATEGTAFDGGDGTRSTGHPAAGAGGGGGALGADVAGALDALLAVRPDDAAGQVAAVLALAEVLGRRGLLPAAHRQRPAWLGRPWGRWRREGAVRRELGRMARSPTDAAVAAATLAGRAHAAPGAARPGGGAGGVPGPWARAAGAREEDTAADDLPLVRDDDPPAGPAADGWGLAEDESLPELAAGVGATDAAAAGREGAAPAGAGGAAGGAGAGALGALHVVQASGADRAAYWQLRGALAPEIERLIEGLRAASDADDAAAPRRFQRAGRLDRARLAAALAGREAVFSRFVHQPEPASALCLLLDCSASMTTRAEQLRRAAIVTESAAAAVGARVSVFTFGADWERLEPPAEGAPLVALGRELHPHGGTPFGEAVTAAAGWLARQPYPRRRLWVFSDGQWSARDRAGTAWRAGGLAAARDVVIWVLGEARPEPPGPAVRVAALPSLTALVRQAPRYFWAGERLHNMRQAATLRL
jgi:hypothetical protein